MLKPHKINDECEDCIQALKRPRVFRGGRVTLMARAKGYVMVRKTRAMPFVLSEKEWFSLPYYG